MLKRLYSLILSSLLVTSLLTGCSSETKSTSSATSSAVSPAKTTSGTGSSEPKTAEKISNEGTVTEVETSSAEPDLISFTSAIAPAEGEAIINIADICEFKLPDELAKRLDDIDAVQNRMTEYINQHTKDGDINPDLWTKAFQGSGYFAAYPDVGFMMTEDVVMQINVYKHDDNIAKIMGEMESSEDGRIFNSIFGEVMTSCCYKAESFSAVSAAGTVEEGDTKIQSYIFASEVEDFAMTDSYFGYLIIGCNAENYFTMLVSGMNKVTQPELLQEIYTSFDTYSEKDSYWVEFQPLEL